VEKETGTKTGIEIEILQEIGTEILIEKDIEIVIEKEIEAKEREVENDEIEVGKEEEIKRVDIVIEVGMIETILENGPTEMKWDPRRQNTLKTNHITKMTGLKTEFPHLHQG